MRPFLWIAMLVLAAGCATARPIETPENPENTEVAHAKLDAKHRQAQADYDRAKAADQASKPKK